MSEIDFTPIVCQKDNWRISLEYKGEGYHGKFDASIDEYHNTQDSPVLQLTIEKKNKVWERIKYGCQNTYLLATDSSDLLQKAGELLLKKVINYKNWTNDDDSRIFLFGLGYVHLREKEICFKEDLSWQSEDY